MTERPTHGRILAGAIVGYCGGAFYSVLLALGVTLGEIMLSARAAELGERVADAGVAAGVGLMIALAAPLLALIVMPVVALTAVLASLATAHVLANARDTRGKRLLAALWCGTATGLALWAMSYFAGGAAFALVGALWLLPAPLAMLTVNWFLFADVTRRGYRTG